MIQCSVQEKHLKLKDNDKRMGKDVTGKCKQKET